MRLFCTNNAHHVNPFIPKPEVGSEYTGVGERLFPEELYFELKEFPPEIINGKRRIIYYHSKGFATLPDPSEEVAIEHEQEALIYQR